MDENGVTLDLPRIGTAPMRTEFAIEKQVSRMGANQELWQSVEVEWVFASKMASAFEGMVWDRGRFTTNLLRLFRTTASTQTEFAAALCSG